MPPSTGPYPFDIVAIFTTLFADVDAVRAARLLPPLVSKHVGKEWLRSEETAPRIVVVPTHNSYEYARVVGQQPMTGLATAANPQTIVTRLMHFEAHLWGDETTSPQSPPLETDLWYSFNTTIELEREFIQALARRMGNITNPRSGLNVRLGDSEWRQPTDMNRLGRLLVLPFVIGFPVTYEPWTVTTPSTIAVDERMVFQDGSSSDQGTFTIP